MGFGDVGDITCPQTQECTAQDLEFEWGLNVSNAAMPAPAYTMYTPLMIVWSMHIQTEYSIFLKS